MGFIGENLGRAKGLNFIFFPLSQVCFLLWGFSGYKEWIIQLIEKLQVVSGAFLKRGRRVRNFSFLFQKGFFGGEEGRMG
jgi:hypothetical protein